MKLFTVLFTGALVGLFGVGYLGGPAYRYGYNQGWFEDEITERRIERIERRLRGTGVPAWAGAYTGGGRSYWLGPDNDAVTYLSGCGAVGIMEEGIGKVSFEGRRLVLDFPVLRKAWLSRQSFREEFAVGRFGKKVFLIEEAVIPVLEQAILEKQHPVHDAHIYFRIRTRGPLEFDEPLQFLGDDGWESLAQRKQDDAVYAR